MGQGPSPDCPYLGKVGIFSGPGPGPPIFAWPSLGCTPSSQHTHLPPLPLPETSCFLLRRYPWTFPPGSCGQMFRWASTRHESEAGCLFSGNGGLSPHVTPTDTQKEPDGCLGIPSAGCVAVPATQPAAETPVLAGILKLPHMSSWVAGCPTLQFMALECVLWAGLLRSPDLTTARVAACSWPFKARQIP